MTDRHAGDTNIQFMYGKQCQHTNTHTPTHTHNLVAEPVLIGTGFWVTVVHRHSLSQNQQHALKEKEREGGGTKNDYQQ